MGKRILVCGGRGYDDWLTFCNAMKLYVGIFRGPNPSITIIQGGASGADFLGKVYAKYVGFTHLEFPADWKQFGKSAGHIRNQQMLDEGKPDLVIAFPGGVGTKDMVARARKAGVEVFEVG
jgi:YspA, cpYpsA-related SLOG family